MKLFLLVVLSFLPTLSLADEVGDGKIGCNNENQAWRYDPMYLGNKFGTYNHKARSGYRLKSGLRPVGNGNPGGNYDGAYRDDYEFVSGFGDLDACNGMTLNDVYGYYITDEFPYMTNCFRGTPDTSFRKGGGGPPP